MATIREALQAWLASNTDLSAIVGSRIYFAQPSQLSSYPCVVIQIPQREYGHNLAGSDGTSVATPEIAAQALTEGSAVAIAEAIRNSMDGFKGMQSGVAIMSCLLGDEADGQTAPPDGSDNWIYQLTIEYRIKHRVPMPTSVTQTNV